ncbi:MAG: hypothetical protein HFJ29_06185 [Clostridia bacterium]|nr:hypothetical protein [Clostridia bacterium]
MSDFVVKSKKKKDYTQFTARIETDVLENIRRIVDENNLESINEFINASLKFAIKNLKVMDEEDS